MSGEGTRTEAQVKRGWKPGWIWAVPLAVAVVLVWLGIRALTSGGTDITIDFDDAHGLKGKNTSIDYRGIHVGKVTAVALAKDGRSVVVNATIDDDAAKFLRSGTRFWLKGANPSLSNLSSLGSVLSGPSIVLEPGPGTEQKHFEGLAHKPVIPAEHDKGQAFEVSFTGPVGELTSGDPVMLDGFTVGEVESISFRYDASTGAITTPVRLLLYPSLFHIRNASGNATNFVAVLDRLVQEGLRARMERDPPLVGSYRVSLAMVPGAPEATPAVFEGTPQIPTAPAEGLDTILDRANKVPIEQIAQNLLDITRHIDKFAASPKLQDSLAELDSTLEQIHQTAAAAGPQIAQLVTRLRDTAGQLDRTAKAAARTLGTTSQSGLQETMSEVKDAARSLRELADYLGQHPEALIKGRSG
jgi:paraquat-inducible protein B